MTREAFRRQLSAVVLAGAFLLAGCDDSPTEPPVDPVPDAIDVSPEELSFTSIGASEQLSETVWDVDGDETGSVPRTGGRAPLRPVSLR